jgi:hypothetical protein
VDVVPASTTGVAGSVGVEGVEGVEGGVAVDVVGDVGDTVGDVGDVEDVEGRLGDTCAGGIPVVDGAPLPPPQAARTNITAANN